MLNNWAIGDPQIIVAAQTNHALDQLLHKIAVFDKDILRLGGRAKEDDKLIQSFTLYSRRLNARRYLSGLEDSRRTAIDKFRRLGSVLIDAIERMNSQPRDEAKTFLELGLLTKAQYDSIANDGWTRSEEDETDFRPWHG